LFLLLGLRNLVRGAGGDGGAFGIKEGNGGTGWEGTMKECQGYEWGIWQDVLLNVGSFASDGFELLRSNLLKRKDFFVPVSPFMDCAS
jgi:hypothetical protein